ncbi:MAG: class I SAM-dependent methyltransferase [Neisseriaceae bacterium]|nr:class I SAM-dependent methyltransferase [Neisseriaceae bacterium]MBP6863082.1 class I SAM-dependent methyltransferase [Neisseriaceae bacterium]
MTLLFTHPTADPLEAQQLSQTYGLTASNFLPEAGVYLHLDDQALSLRHALKKGEVSVNFVSGSLDYRRQKGGGELINKAINHKQNQTVWDFTGGLGRDAFIMASSGLCVTVFERHPAVAALLADGLKRAAGSPELAPIMANITLHHLDVFDPSLDWASIGPRPDVVYLDPMYPDSKKSAAVKKEMAYFHELVGTSGDAGDLLPLALGLAKKRVIVKRPRLGAWLNEAEPAYQYQGKSTRFDGYTPPKQAI